MADVLNRTTKELLRSVNTPDYPVSDWIHSPDLSAVDGRPLGEWKIAGDVISLKSDGDWTSDELDAYKQRRIAEIDGKTAGLFEAGFTFDGKSFSLSHAAQTNWVAIQSAVDAGRATFPWPVSMKDGGEYNLTDATHATTFTGTALLTGKGYYDSGRAIRVQVLAAATKSAGDAIQDNR